MLSEAKQATIVITGKVQFIGSRGYLEELSYKYDLGGLVYNGLRDGTVKFLCEGRPSKIGVFVEKIKESPGVRVTVLDGVVLPKPAGREVIGIERDIFDRRDLGVARLGSIEEHTGSMMLH